MYLAYLFLFLSIVGLTGVTLSPFPLYAAIYLVVVAGGGFMLLVCFESSFLALILLLVYLGGMLVVFAYSVAFMASMNPEDLGNYSSNYFWTSIVLSTFFCCLMFMGEPGNDLYLIGVSSSISSLVQSSNISVAFLYKEGGGFLMIGSLALLVALLVVLMVVRGTSRGALRAV